MRFIFLVRNLFILHLLFVPLVFAGQFTNPYQGNIVVSEQNESELKALALKQVLVKVSGNTEIEKLNESKRIFSNVDPLLSQYGYQTYHGVRYFTAVFDKPKIDQNLKTLQQPIWGETRPVTLVWLVSEDNNRRQFISDNTLSQQDEADTFRVFQNLQHNRGISLQFPLMDLEDSLALSLSDVSGRFYSQVRDASERYGVEHFIVANLKQKNQDDWSLSWELVKSGFSGKPSRVVATDRLNGNKLALISAMVNDIADYYADQYAIVESPGAKLSQTIYIHGINSLKKLTQLNNILEKLVAIDSFEVISVQGGQVTIDIDINGGLESFKNGLFAQSNLQPDLSQSEEFHFNWR